MHTDPQGLQRDRPLPGETHPARVLDTAAVNRGTQSHHVCKGAFSRCRSHEGSAASRPSSRLQWEPGSPRARRPAWDPYRRGAALLGPPVKGMVASDFESPDIYTI